MKSKEILSFFNDMAPEAYQASWDNSGVQIVGVREHCSKVAVCLEPTPDMVQGCLDWGADVILTHHPLYMKPKGLAAAGDFTDVVRMVMGAGAWLYAAHTSLDCSPNGPAFWLGSRLELRNAQFLEEAHSFTALEVSFDCTRTLGEEEVRKCLLLPGICKVRQDSFGEVHLVCHGRMWTGTQALLEEFLGEKPVYYTKPLTSPAQGIGFGQVGDLPEPLGWDTFLHELLAVVDRDVLTLCGEAPATVSRVAYCGGSGTSLAQAAARLQADVFITGDMKYHPAVETPLCVVDVGHFSLEEEMMRLAALELAETLNPQDVAVRFFKGTEPLRFHLRRKA